MFIEPHFVGIYPTQPSLKTGGPQQQGFTIKYIIVIFIVNNFLKVLERDKSLDIILWTVTVIGKKNIKRKLAMTSLILATFFNPLGFDALFALIMKWTGSYWTTDLIFYCLSGLFFGLYFWLSPTSRRGYYNLVRKLKNFIK